MIILNYVIASLLLIMLIEYFAHKYLMHKRLAPSFKWIDGFFIRHTIWHHKDERTDTNIDLPWAWATIYSIPFVLLSYFLDIRLGLVILTMSLFYAVYWTKLHRAYHNIERNWTMFLPWYRRTWDHHINHHFFPKKNYGTVFWFSDYLFGTKI